MSTGWHDYLTTREVADYLRIKERRVYEMIRQRTIPCTRVTGKWLFPRALIDRWVTANLDGEHPGAAETPPVIAGSHDPLLEWAVGNSGCGLALKGGGSLDGLERLRDGEARLAGIHLHDLVTGTYNVEAVRGQPGLRDVVTLTWAWRRQGLILPVGNPDGVTGLADLATGRVPVAERQAAAGSRVLFEHLLASARVDPASIAIAPGVLRTELEVGLAVLGGEARAGFAVEPVARSLNLDFLPLTWDRFDLVVGRRDAFEPAMQSLLAFARTATFRDKATALGGYDIAELGAVQYNAP